MSTFQVTPSTLKAGPLAGQRLAFTSSIDGQSVSGHEALTIVVSSVLKDNGLIVDAGEHEFDFETVSSSIGVPYYVLNFDSELENDNGESISLEHGDSILASIEHRVSGVTSQQLIVIPILEAAVTDEAVPNRTINAIDFGGRQNRLNYPVIPAVSIQRFSFSCWVRVLGQPDGTTSGTIFEHFQTTPESRHTFRLLLSSGGGRFLHSRRDATSTQTTRGQFNDGAWHHAVLTVAGSDVKIYVDGFEEPVEPSAVGYPSANENSFGWQDSGAVASANTLADWRFYDRVVSAEEVRSIYNDGLFDNNDSVSDYYARWNPSVIDSVQVADSGPNGIHATWADYDRRAYISADGVDPVNGLVSLYAIGDSLTEDADPETLLPITAKLINEGQPLSFHLANPPISTEI